MARSIVFTNSIGGVLTVSKQGDPFLLTSFSGLGSPVVNVQSQKAPYQNGTTYIDSLLADRILTCEFTINKPNDFTEIDTARRELMNKLNPTLGPGVIVYTTEGGTVYRITATVSGVTIPDKKYNEPFLRCQVIFTANEPFWKGASDTTVSLPTITNKTPYIIKESNVMQGGSVIQLLDSSYLIVYYEFSGGVGNLACKTSTDGITWSAENVISSLPILYYPTVIQKYNGAIYLVSIGSSGIESRTSTDGIAWSAPLTISATGTFPSLIKTLDGGLLLTYSEGATGHLTKRTSTDGITWSAPSIISAVAMNVSALCQKETGVFFCIYRLSAGELLVYKTSVDGVTWSSETSLGTTTSGFHTTEYVEEVNAVNVYFSLSSVLYKLQIVGGLVVDPIPIFTGDNSGLTRNEKNNLLISVVYNPGVNGLYAFFRSVNPVDAPIDGDVPSPITVTFTGPSTNPRIVKQETLEFIRLNTSIAAGDTFVVNTAFGQKTVVLTQGGIARNGTAFLDISSTFLQLTPGANTIYFEDDAELSTATASMVYTNRYVGI